MITAYLQREGVWDMVDLSPEDGIPEHTMWIDLFRPDDDERQWLSRYLYEEAPDEEDINEIEASARFYLDNDGLHINSLFPQRVGSEVRAINVFFLIQPTRLFTIREEDVGLIRLLRNYLRLGRIEADRPQGLLVELFNLKVDYLSDQLEDVYTVLDELSEEVFDNEKLDEVFKQITLQEDGNGKIRLSLLDTQRGLRYMQRYYRRQLQEDEIKDVKEMLSDIESLLPHTQFLFDKINFLLDAAMGFTSLQQNKIIKIFSVAAVVFLPPTLIASIYGMNFTAMPELAWEVGYPLALGLMFSSAVGTYWFFKRKGWL
ncbi:magnesium/cobalt transporter CorA [Ferrimonas sp. SCSIO 43195]|uniref:magnesium/cobalt transporter CorA n=1 Tax=Ferrimonas sp. SCSIO 43195 TaxID=2822844 RepID=UPI002075CFD4|nr:magnesium/cobalt transporter CorA [Ferrimonas sp. SCSIO 43195]USD36127.1 magnesium/cobalt transporter CorA [Ferrimonas sp. SCSIO 43195]